MTRPENSGGAPASARRLASSASAYLRAAAGQPIDWHPWSDEPFRQARETHRPILLDIGAVWCHWCHVMDEGTYADPEVARLLADHFVAVKVDRDELPEVDRRFQREVGALTGQGGWPLTAFLTPEGEVFLGGTYFPAEDAHGRPGFRRLLREVARLWGEEPARLLGHLPDLRRALAADAGVVSEKSVDLEGFRRGVRERLVSSLDPVHGGFGFAPKFPHPVAAEALLADGLVSNDAVLSARAREMLQAMADGGLYDQVGGGFHRYCVDEGWHIPHFEKIATDNAELLAAYVAGAKAFSLPRFVETIRGTVGWVAGTLADPGGGFGSSQDADNAPGDDGGYFTWSRAELAEALGPAQLRLALRLFGVGTEGRMPHDPDRNVLYRMVTADEANPEARGDPLASQELVARTVAALAQARARRPPPVVDRALYANVNGSLIRALAIAGTYLGDPGPVALARRAADRFLDRAFRPEVGLGHRLTEQGGEQHGLLDDQAQFALGLVELAAATLERRYLEAAEALLSLIDTEFPATPGGPFRSVAPRLYDGPEAGRPTTPSFPFEDAPHLSAHSAYALAVLRRSALVADPDRSRAERVARRAASRLADAGVFGAGAYLAATLLSAPAARVVVEGSGPAAQALVRAAQTAGHPNLVVFPGAPAPAFAGPEADGPAPSAAPRALVCVGDRCLAPVTDASELRGLIGSTMGPGRR